MSTIEEKDSYDVLTICRYIAYYCYRKRYNLTNLRLQKLLYFIQLYFFLCHDEPCFKNRMEAWDLGPVVPDAYQHYKKYGAKEIPVEKGDSTHLLKKEDSILITAIIEALSDIPTFQLVNMTHKQLPWKKNYVPYNSNEIPLSDLKEFADEQGRKS